MSVVYLDGRFVPAGEARVPAAAAGVLFGRGVYETFRARDGAVFLLDRHIARLRDGCAVLGIEPPAAAAELPQIVRDLAARCALPDARVRVTLAAGMPGAPPSLLIQAREATDYPESLYERGMSAVLAAVRRNETSPLSRIKSLNCLDSIMSREQAIATGADTALLLNTQGRLAEASTANVFVVKDGAVLTPPVAEGALPGVTRSFVLEEASEAALALDDVLSSDEAFLTGAVMGVMPLVRVDARPVANGRPGPVTAAVRQRYEAARLVAAGL